MTQKYVLGFLFNEDRTKVLLLSKRRPVGQAGKLNGIGGKVEPNESWADAMTREFSEEAEVEGRWSHWTHRATLNGISGEGLDYVVRVYEAVTLSGTPKAAALTDEPVAWQDLDCLGERPIMHHLAWLVPMLADVRILPGSPLQIDIDG